MKRFEGTDTYIATDDLMILPSPRLGPARTRADRISYRLAPAKMSKAFIAVLNREANWAMRQPDVRDKMIALGLDVPDESPEYFDQLICSDFEKYGNVAR